MRVVSLLASGTEIVCGLGAGGLLVGRSHECDNPPWVRTLPSCTQPAFDTTRPSGEIDAEVKRRLRAGEPLYHIDRDLIARLEPDLLITQVHCDVCAVTPADVERAGCAIVAGQVSLSANSIDEIYDSVRRVAAALALNDKAEALIHRMQQQIASVRHAVHGSQTPTVAILEWTDPVFASGNWVPELVECAGGQSLLGTPGHHSTPVPWGHVVGLNPDYLIIAPCGFNLERALHEIPTLEALSGWFDLTAVREGRVVFADGNTFFNRSGTTIVETVQILAEILHGDRVHMQWRDRAWLTYDAVSRVALAGRQG